MKYLIGLMLFVGLVTFLLVGCSNYRSKSKPIIKPKIEESAFIDYNYGDFEDVVDLTDRDDVYHVKYVHIVL